jgi:AcrR family transcriptional regulator
MITRTARTERTRARILEGAAAVVRARRIRAATVEDILQAAGVSRRTFYQYFGSKEAALTTLYEELTTELVAGIEAALRTADDPFGKVEAGVRVYLDHQELEGELLINLQAEAVRVDSMLAPRRDWTFDRLVSLFDATVREVAGWSIDPLVYRTLMLGIEGLSIHQTGQGGFSTADRARVEAVGIGLWKAALAGEALMPEAPCAPIADPVMSDVSKKD